MTTRLIMAAVFGSFATSAVMAQVWQETAAGALQLQPAMHLPTGCAVSDAPSYLSSPFSGHPLYNRVQFDGEHFSFSADGGVVPLQVVPHQFMPIAGAASAGLRSHAALWGMRSSATGRGSSALSLFWHDGSVIRAARFTLTPLQWQPQWMASYQPSAIPWLSVQLAVQRLADDPTNEWLVLPGDAQVPVRLFNANNGLPRQLSLPATIGTFGLQPLAADPDQDGLAERLYLLSQQGALWQYDWQHGSGWRASLVADLQSSGWDFSGSLQRFSARWQSVNGWQDGEVFVILARSGTDHRLLVLRRETNQQQALTFADVTAAPDLTKAGWYTEVLGAPLSPAKLLAGILYLPVKADTGCADDAVYDRVLALQLYSGAAAYEESLLRLPQPVQAPLRMVQSTQQLQLWSGSIPIISQLVMLNSACLMCTEPLTIQHLQGQQTIAVFRREQVY